ncbi:tetratricopeptide repeat protein [Horticoccus sp. 23ND18S-11]|uniref:tetratricopeptide repeat protein n=1 Tax=Horticoccus sp. 23ND18S-11 TaxID=3391832 RepID=UPI0039C915F5
MSTTVREAGRWPISGAFALILMATLVAYFPALTGDFLWDDAGHVTHPSLQSWSGLGRIWFEVGATQQYYPLLHTAFWIEHRLWGDATTGYHLVNVLWHATSACLLIAFLRRLAIPGALLAGLVFALHPVAVESVAWIAEQKNTLSTVFYLTAALAWLRFEDDRRPGRYAVASLWFLAALLTKTVTATLPAALLVVAWWRHGRMSWRGEVRPLLPWFGAGLGAGLVTAHLEATQIGASGADFALGGIERVLLAGRVVWFYLGKLLWPADLTFFYPRWTIDATIAWQWLFPMAALLLLAALVWWRRRDRAPLAAALLFGGTLFPVLGFVNVYPFVFSYVADHFQYLASIGMIAFLTAGATRGFARLAWPRWSGPALAAAVLMILGTLTWRQSGQYRDVFALYESTLARNPSSWAAHLNLGTAWDDAGEPEKALPHLQQALALKPGRPETLNTLGNVLNRLGRASEALPLLEQAVRLQPRFAAAHNTHGAALMTLGRADDGIAAFRRALDLNPKLTPARVNLGWALGNQGRVAEAVAQFEQAHRLQPELADVEFKWALILALHDRVAEALPHFERAVALQPDNPEARHALGRALLAFGRNAEAAAHFQEALRVAPQHAGARAGLERLGRRHPNAP